MKLPGLRALVWAVWNKNPARLYLKCHEHQIADFADALHLVRPSWSTPTYKGTNWFQDPDFGVTRVGAQRFLCVWGPGLVARLPGCPCRWPAGVEQRLGHWEGCPWSPRRPFCVSCLCKGHAGNPAAGPCQEVKDTESRAMGKGDREGEGNTLILSTRLKRIGGKEEQKLFVMCTKRKRLWSSI